jgi:hypothetical protein
VFGLTKIGSNFGVSTEKGIEIFDDRRLSDSIYSFRWASSSPPCHLSYEDSLKLLVTGDKANGEIILYDLNWEKDHYENYNIYPIPRMNVIFKDTILANTTVEQ